MHNLARMARAVALNSTLRAGSFASHSLRDQHSPQVLHYAIVELITSRTCAIIANEALAIRNAKKAVVASSNDKASCVRDVNDAENIVLDNTLIDPNLEPPVRHLIGIENL